ncbi:hypothetical protein ACFX2I_015110 [Malus domestica]|uniref:Uncharacterized protein n=1 Tax=Malus domestica TaxID=3750 RepID=A0A498I3R6_MALDO|nr:hypothetical protein DVH24_039801 [Malus domestica]
MEGDDQKELQLLPSPHWMTSPPSDSSIRYRRSKSAVQEGPNDSQLDLQLSISVRPAKPSSSDCYAFANPNTSEFDVLKPKAASCMESLKWQAAEQIRLAATEKAYAERVRELARREMELAQSEFTRARHMWERAREEVEKAERMKEKAMLQMDSTCMEITCQSCRQRFRP